MNGYKKLGKNVLLFSVGNFATKFLGYFLIPFYTSVLTTTEYGTSDLIVTTVNLIFPIFTLLVSEAVMRFALEKDNNTSQIFSIGVYTTLIGFIVMTIFSPLLLLSSTLKSYYWIFILYYLISNIYTLFSQFIKGIEKITIYTVSSILNTALVLILNVLFLLIFRLGIVGYLYATIISQAIAGIFLFIQGKMYKYLLNFKSVDIIFTKKMFRYAIPMIPNTISWWISTSCDRYFLTVFCGVGVMGVYSIAYKIPSLLTAISSIFLSAWQISAVEDFGSERSRRFYSNVYNKYSSICIIISSAIIVLVKIIANILFAKDFFQAWVFTPILVISFLFNAMATFIGTIYTSSKKTKMMFYSTIIAAGVNIILNFALIPFIGAIGAAIATLVSYFVVWLFRVINTRSIMKVDIDFKGDIFCYLLLLSQIVIVCIDAKNAFVYSIVIFIIILTQKRKYLIEIVKFMLEILNRIRVLIGICIKGDAFTKYKADLMYLLRK